MGKQCRRLPAPHTLGRVGTVPVPQPRVGVATVARLLKDLQPARVRIYGWERKGVLEPRVTGGAAGLEGPGRGQPCPENSRPDAGLGAVSTRC